MNFNNLELTFIPSKYWSEPLSGFKLLTKGKILPKGSNFFIFWVPVISSEDELEKRIHQTFPSIPANKLLTCEILLAMTSEFSKNDGLKNLNKQAFGVFSFKAKIIPLGPIIKTLQAIDIYRSNDRNIKSYSNSIKTWAFFTKLVFELLNKGQFVPILESLENKQYIGQWRLLLNAENDKKRFKDITINASPLAFNLPVNFFSENGAVITEGLWHPSYLFSRFIDIAGDFIIRFILNKKNFTTFKEFYSSDMKRGSDYALKSEWDYRFLRSLLSKNSNFPITEFYETIIPSLIENWANSARGFSFGYVSLFSFILKYPNKPDGDWPLTFAISPPGEGNPIILNKIWKMDNKTQQKTFSPLNTDKSPIELILRALGTAAKIFPPINRALQEKHPSEIRLSSNEVIDFLKYPKDLMIQSGFNIILPEMFTTGGKQRLSARLVIRTSEKKSSKKGISSQFDSMFDINSMLEYKWEASLGEQKISEDEFLNLLNSTDPLVNIKGNWVLVEFNDIEALRDASNSGKKTYIEALKLGLTGKIQLQENGPEYEVVVEGEFGEIVQKLKTIDTLKEISCPLGFRGELRPYQEDALSWMGNLSTLNLGLCLADDMGLGKTVQVIAFLLFRKELLNKNAKSILIICPTSVLFNWRREMEKFAPELSITVHHGLDRIKNALDLKKYLKPNEIVLTTYGTARNDVDILQVIPFDGIIIDESQNIKNYSSQQTQAILRLQAKFRIALSGTPVENRLLELWTLFEFLNPGLLGSKTEFQDNYILPIERFQDKDAIDKLKKVISPFILRRVKTDKSIINDLPEKNEIKLFVELSNEQINLYQNAVDTAFKEMKDAENNKKKKKGILLALLVKLKQICNHPYQYSKKSFKKCKDKEMIRDFSSRSKKTKRLVQMIEEVIDNGEKVLVFTQFKEMGSLLQNLLESIFNFKVLFFHGSVPEHKRREIVDKFQSKDIESPPILILSLKAGGTGLNLTQGTTIFHFDRWWNPAVEDQATDRAYRIGQKERVNVYKFITVGTIEEKIDMLLEDKKQLAESVITSSGESWISDLSEDKLKEMLSLTI